MISTPLFAGNGFNIIGSGARSIGMGGADVALVGDAHAIAINPAGITQVSHSRVDLNLYSAFNGYAHRDMIGNRGDSDNDYSLITSAGYVRRLKDNPDLFLGISMFATGGAGFIYDNLRTPFNNPRDDLSLLFGVFRISPALGWQVNDRLSLGATVSLNYATLEQEFFPQTSDANAGFFGLDLEGAKAIKLNGSAGLQYRLTDTLSVGWTYISETRLPLKEGELKVNYSDIGFGRVEYRDVFVDGFALPQESSIGLAWKPRSGWLIAADIKWIDWSVIESTTLTARQPDNPNLPANLQQLMLSTPVEMNDQYVYSLGTEFQLATRHVLRLGTMYGANPMPDRNLTPVLNLTQEYEFDIGYGYFSDNGWEINLAIQYIPDQEFSYNNPNLPLGAGAETFGAYSLNLDWAWEW